MADVSQAWLVRRFGSYDQTFRGGRTLAGYRPFSVIRPAYESTLFRRLVVWRKIGFWKIHVFSNKRWRCSTEGLRDGARGSLYGADSVRRGVLLLVRNNHRILYGASEILAALALMYVIYFPHGGGLILLTGGYVKAHPVVPG